MMGNVMIALGFVFVALVFFVLGCVCGHRAAKRMQARRVIEKANRDLQEQKDSNQCRSGPSRECAGCEFFARCDAVADDGDEDEVDAVH